jgi:hypothetical protein
MSISRIVFAGRDASGNTTLGVTTRTSAGTSVLAVAGANADGLFDSNHFQSDFPPGFTVLGNLALFEGYDANGTDSLWVTDGTSAGTGELSVAGSDAGGLFVNVIAPHLTVFAGQALFVGEDANGTISLWSTDGTGEVEVMRPGYLGYGNPVSGAVSGEAAGAARGNFILGCVATHFFPSIKKEGADGSGGIARPFGRSPMGKIARHAAAASFFAT